MARWVARRRVRASAADPPSDPRRLGVRVGDGQSPQPAQPAVHARGGHLAPVDVVLGRGGEQHGGSQGVGAVDAVHLDRRDQVAPGLAHGGAVEDHLALVEQGLEGLVGGQQPLVAQGLDHEAGVEQVQHRVFDTAGVLGHRQHRVGQVAGPGLLGVVGRQVAQEVPGRVDEGVHGVGVALGVGAALGTGHELPGGVRGQRRPVDAEVEVVGQLDRQVLLGHRDRAALGAVDDRHRRAPRPLARHQPVAEAELHRGLGQPSRRQGGGDGPAALDGVQAVELARVHQGARDRRRPRSWCRDPTGRRRRRPGG